MKTGAFVIHLKRARKRGDHVRALLGRLPIKADIIDAIDGQALSEAQIRAVYALALHRPRYPFQLSASEVACFLSHRKAWQMIVDGGLDAGLVIEDDVEVSEDAFASQLKLALERIRPADYIRFPRWTRGERGPAVAAAGADTIIEPSLPGLGMQMQLVGREAAAALLAATERFDRPVDTTIQMRWLHPVRVLSVRPVSIREIDFDLGGSVVQNKRKSLSERLWREICRPWYRVALYLHNCLRA